MLGLLVCLLALGGCPAPEPPPPRTYTVQRGDSVGRIAKAHGVRAADLRRWNRLDSDLIHPGQVLVVQGPGGSARAPEPPRARPPTRTTRTPVGDDLAMPTPERCLPPHSGEALGDRGAAVSTGLDRASVKAAVDAILPRTTACVQDEVPSGMLQVRLVVGCDGVVDRAQPLSGDAWPDDVARCVAEVLRHADFPAHGLPDGDEVVVPVGFAP